jgi:hypothetical protein
MKSVALCLLAAFISVSCVNSKNSPSPFRFRSGPSKVDPIKYPPGTQFYRNRNEERGQSCAASYEHSCKND